MFKLVMLCPFLRLASLCTVLIIGIIGCGGDDNGTDDNGWVGTWSLETFDGQGLEQVLAQELGTGGVTISLVANNWTFNNDETLEAEISLKIGNQGGGSAIAITSSTKTTGTYSLSGSNYTLTLEAIPIASLKESTGTWHRSGNILTLSRDGIDDTTVVFKKQ